MVNRELKVDVLNQEESYSMFTNLLEDRSFRGADLIALMTYDIVDICGGLPLMINVAAKYFKVRGNDYSWAMALVELRKWPKQGDTMKEAYNRLKSFFDSLDETTQRCFLYASLYPANTEILAKLLVSCWEAKGLLIDEHTFEKVDRDYNGRQMLHSLLDIGLIHADELYCRVKLHPLIRRAYLHYVENNEDIKAFVKSRGNEFPEVHTRAELVNKSCLFV